MPTLHAAAGNCFHEAFVFCLFRRLTEKRVSRYNNANFKAIQRDRQGMKMGLVCTFGTGFALRCLTGPR